MEQAKNTHHWGKDHCTACLQFYKFGSSCFTTYNKQHIFSALTRLYLTKQKKICCLDVCSKAVESKLVKLETTRTVIMPPQRWMFSGGSDAVPNCRRLWRRLPCVARKTTGNCILQYSLSPQILFFASSTFLPLAQDKVDRIWKSLPCQKWNKMYFFEIWNTINFVMPSFCYALLQSDVFPFKLRGYILYTYKFYKLLANVGAKSFLNGPLFSLFSVFSNITFFTTNQCENMSIQYPVPDSNQQPHEHESSPITTRPGLLLTFNVSIKTCSSFFNLFPYWGEWLPASLFLALRYERLLLWLILVSIWSFIFLPMFNFSLH